MVALFAGIYVIKDEHVRVIDGTTLPLTLFRFKEAMKPQPVSARIHFIALVISTRVLFVMLIINGPLARATVRLKTITIT